MEMGWQGGVSDTFLSTLLVQDLFWSQINGLCAQNIIKLKSTTKIIQTRMRKTF